MSVSESQSPQYPLWVDQALIDGLVESTILQSFFTGVYTLIFFQAIVYLVRQQKRLIVVILSILFIAIMVNLVATWQILRSAVVTHDATRNTITQDIFSGPSHMQKVVSGTLAFSVIISDTFLAWRCYVLWQQNKWMLVGYSLVLLGELAVLPVYLALNITLGPYWNVLDLYFAVSLCITIISSVLIIYRISDVSRGNNATSRYRHTIKILVESGLLYTTVILICGILLIIQVFGIHNSWLIRVTQGFEAILVPLTGIAPTLITARNAKACTKISDPERSQVISRMSFKQGESKQDAMSFDDTDLHITTSNWQARTV